MNRLQQLLDSAKDLVRPLHKPRTFRRLWTQRLPATDVEKLKHIATVGRTLAEGKATAFYQELLSIKTFLQVRDHAQALIPDGQGRTQYDAAVRWQAVEQVFREVEARIARGQEAKTKLEKLTI